MNKWKLVSDSSSDLTFEEDGNSFAVPFASVPLIVKVDNKDYVDNFDTDPVEMMAHIKQWGKYCATSCPSVSEYMKAFKDADNIICVTISNQLSGSYNSALQARTLILEEYPDRNIYILDSLSTAGNIILILRYANELIKQNIPFEEVVKKLEEYRNHVKIIFSLANFGNLVNAGRMSKITGMIASALKIRPLAVNSKKGTIDVIEKPRGKKKAMEHIVLQMANYKNMDGLDVIITHCQNDDEAETLKKMIEKKYNVRSVELRKTRCLTSYYSDVGSLLVCF